MTKYQNLVLDFELLILFVVCRLDFGFQENDKFSSKENRG